MFTNIFTTHVHTQPHNRIINHDQLKHQYYQFPLNTLLNKKIHFDKTQIVTKILTTNQSKKNHTHPFDIHILPLITHQTTHIHQHHHHTLQNIARTINHNILNHHPYQLTNPITNKNITNKNIPYHNIDHQTNHIHINYQITKFILFNLLHLHNPFTNNKPLISPTPQNFELTKNTLQ